MNAFRNYIETNDGIVVFLENKTVHVLRTNPLFPVVQDKIQSFDFAAIPDIVDTASRIRKYTGGSFWVDDFGVVVLDGETIPESLSKRLLEFVDQGLPTEPLELFWGELKENESEDARKDLFGFLRHNDVSMTKEGHILAYKRVKRIEDPEEGQQVLIRSTDAETGEDVMVWVEALAGDLVDIRTGTIRNNPGDRPFMPRCEVDADRESHCSTGLHVAAYAYADTKYYHNGDLLEVLVNPRDVVAVPTDYNGEKMRVSDYAVSRIAGLPRTEPLAFTEGAEVEYTDPDDGDKEEVEVVKAHGGHPNRYDVRAGDGIMIMGVAQNDLSWPSNWDDDDDEDYDEDEDEDDTDSGVRYDCSGHADDEPEEDPKTKALREIKERADRLSEDASQLIDGFED